MEQKLLKYDTPNQVCCNRNVIGGKMERIQHYAYLDALRGIAILAVVIDHTYQLMYSSDIVLQLSTFSVTLFVLLSGITAYLSMKKRNGGGCAYVRHRLRGILIPYAYATAFCILINGAWNFSFVDYIKALIFFNGAAPYYYIFFFIQLITISPVLYVLTRLVYEPKRYHYLINGCIILGVIISAYECTEHTTMLELHGGGNYLFGGSYLFVYFSGMLLAEQVTVRVKRRAVVWIGILSFIGLVGYIFFVLKGNSNYVIYDKWGGNPPGAKLWIYSLFIFGLVYALYNLGDSWGLILSLGKPLETIGKYSLYIFLYHLYFIIVLRNTLYIKIPITYDNIWLRRSSGVLVAIVFPIFLKWIYDKGKRRILNYINSTLYK